MNNDLTKALAEAYIDHYMDPEVWDEDTAYTKRDNLASEWAIDKIFDITFENPEELWDLILEILHRNPPVEVKQVLAAGPLEDYLAKCGEKVIERVEAQAAKDKKFKSLLGGVWQNTMPESVWSRVQACWDRSEWDNGV